MTLPKVVLLSRRQTISGEDNSSFSHEIKKAGVIIKRMIPAFFAGMPDLS
jgi:hypothetical protein